MKRKRGRPGKKHRLLFFRHSMDRLWRTLVILDIFMWAAAWFAPYSSFFSPPNDWPLILAAAACLILIFGIIAIRNMSYVQAHQDHLRIAMPYYKLKVPYSHTKTSQNQKFENFYSRSKMSWSEKRFLGAYFGAPVIVIPLKKYPKPLGTLKMLLPSYLFLPKGKGFLFLIRDGLKFSTEFDSKMIAARGMNPSQKDTETEGMYNLFSE